MSNFQKSKVNELSHDISHAMNVTSDISMTHETSP